MQEFALSRTATAVVLDLWGSDGVGGKILDQSRSNLESIVAMDELKEVGLHNMPKKWYEQAQLVLWPKDEPLETFLHI